MLICIGPADGGVTGQSECLKKIKNSYSGSKLISNGGEGLLFIHKVVLALLAVCQLTYLTITNHDSKVLFSVSRSPEGFIKDLPIFAVCYIMRIDTLLHIHGNDVGKLFECKYVWLNKLAKFFYSKADAIIVPSPFMKSQFSIIPNVPIKILPNFHDVEDIDLDRKRTELSGARKLLYLSSVMEDKGIFDVLSCYERLIESPYELELHIAGPMMLGAEAKALFFKKLEQLGGFYYGTVKGKVKSKLLSEADVLIFPSKYQTEAAPLVILEAMSTETAVLVYSHNYIEKPLPVDTYEYQVVNNYDFNELVIKMQILLKSANTLDVCKAKNKIEAQKYTLERYITGLRKIVEGYN